MKIKKLLAQRREEKRISQERINDVLLLLEYLVIREETTVKLILDCLYDIGSINLINKKFRNQNLSKTIKAIAWMSKPIFRVFAWKWFKNNCPQLITNWLQEQVTFKELEKEPKPEPIPIISANESDFLLTETKHNQEIHRLRVQVRLLTGICLGTVTIFSSSLIWLAYNLQLEPSDLIEPNRSKVNNQHLNFLPTP